MMDATTPTTQLPTPADLRCMRMLLGMARREVAQIIGVTEDEARTLERMRTHFVYAAHAGILLGMVERVNSLIAVATADEEAKPEFLFCFPNDNVFELYEPDLAKWMRFNNVHILFTARLMDEWMRLGHRPIIVEIVPAQYDDFLANNGWADSYDSRVEWARQHMKVVTLREGMPRRTGLRTEAEGARR